MFLSNKAIQLQPALCLGESTAQHPPSTQEPFHPTTPVSQYIQSNPTTGESSALCDTPALLSTSQLLGVTTVTNAITDGGITQILLEDVPVQIVDASSISELECIYFS